MKCNIFAVLNHTCRFLFYCTYQTSWDRSNKRLGLLTSQQVNWQQLMVSWSHMKGASWKGWFIHMASLCQRHERMNGITARPRALFLVSGLNCVWWGTVDTKGMCTSQVQKCMVWFFYVPLSVSQPCIPMKSWPECWPTRAQRSTGVKTTTNTLNM